MITALLALLLAAPASAGTPVAVNPALDALHQTASNPTESFDGSRTPTLTVETLVPVGEMGLMGEKRAPAPDLPKGDTYIFEGKTPVSGITIYTPKKDETGNGSTGSDGGSPTDKYGKWGKIGVGVGIGLIAVGLALGGWPAVALGIVGGLLAGAGGVLAFLFGRKK